MCGRFIIFDEAEDKELRSIIDEINRKYKDEDGKFKTGEIFPTNDVPIITKGTGGHSASRSEHSTVRSEHSASRSEHSTARSEHSTVWSEHSTARSEHSTVWSEHSTVWSERDVSLLKWGFPNFRNNGVIINAKSETLHERPTFKKILFTKRCLIPASGFFEWKKTDDPKVKEKYLIQTENDMFYMAGLYNEFVDKSGIRYNAFVIITTEANEQMAPIHDRMPVILDNSESEKWFGADTEVAVNMLVPYASKLRFKVESLKQQTLLEDM
jgi:putative SOS response-associated peptidase YedK